jgi:hypothetical protein
VAKATFWTVTDTEARKRGEQTGLDTLVVHAVNDEHQVSRAWWYSGATLRFVHFVYRAFTFCGGTFQFSSTIHASLSEWSTTPDKSGLGSSPFARRYSGNRCFFLFLRVLRCFSSPGYLLYTYFIQYRVPAHYHR